MPREVQFITITVRGSCRVNEAAALAHIANSDVFEANVASQVQTLLAQTWSLINWSVTAEMNEGKA